jgi:hypothetical protein
MNIKGETEERVATPFGCVDLVFKLPRKGATSRFEIRVSGDIDGWMLNESVFREFKSTFIRFIHGIAFQNRQDLVDKHCQLEVHFQGEKLDIKLPWPEEREACGGRDKK